MERQWSWRRLVLFGTIPLIVVTVAARQAYLNAHFGLSTWKGGGMGMFAGADGGTARFARVYVEMPDGRRHIVVRMTALQDKLLEQALWYPHRGNFLELAQSLRRTSFIAADQPIPVQRADAKGQSIGPTGHSYYLLHADAPRPQGDEPEWTLVIEYWALFFDQSNRLARSSLVEAMRFGPTLH
jgi:hypothetical protein